MIRNIITAAILLAAFVSMTSIVQIASAVEPELSHKILSAEDYAMESNRFLVWTPDMAQQKRVNKEYQRLIAPQNIESSNFSGTKTAEQRLWSFEVYQGDGLHDLRKPSKHHNNLVLPDEDEDAYGVTVKQRF